MTVTLQSILDEARIQIGDSSPSMNQVSTSTTTSIQFAFDLGTIQPGTRVSVGLQTFYVWSVVPATRTASVVQVQGPVAALPAGSLAFCSPRYSGYEMMVAANSTLNSISAPASGLYQMKATEVTYSAARAGYDVSALTGNMGIYEILAQQPGPYKNWVRMQSWAYRLERVANLTDFPSGTSLTLFTVNTDNYPLRITYRAPFTAFGLATPALTLAQTAASIGLPDSAADVVSLGVAIRLLSGAEVARNDISVQGNARRAQEVPAGAQQNSVGGLRLLYQQRLAEEAGRLAAFFPAYREG